MTKTCPHAASGCDYPASECAGHCAGKRQPEALRLADALENDLVGYDGMSIPRIGQNIADEAATELRRLYAENEDFRATCDHLTRENAEQIGEIVALKEKLDDLLVALRIAAVAAEATVCNVKWVARHCRSAIAKAEGEKS